MAFREVVGHFKNYLAAQLATKALAFVSIPVLTHLLTPNDYGITSIYLSYVAIFSVIFTLSTETAISRYYFEPNADFKSFVTTSVILSFGLYFIASVSVIVFRKEIAQLLSIDTLLLILLIPAIGINVLNSIFEQVFSPQKQSKKIAAVSSIRAYILFALSVVFILLLGEKKYMGQPLAVVATGLLVAIYWLYQLKPYLKGGFKSDHIKYIVSYSIPLVPYYLSGIIIEQFDRVMINNYKGSTSAGLFSFAYSIGGLMALVVSITHQAWAPYYYEYMSKENYTKHDEDINRIWRLTLVAAAGLSYFGYEIGYLMGAKSFHVALPIIPIVVLGILFYQAFYIYARHFGHARKTWILSFIVISVGVITVLMNTYAIPKWGYIAAAYTTAISYLLMFILAWYINKYFIGLHSTPLFLLARPFAFFILVYIGYFFLLEVSVYWIQVGIKVVIFSLFSFLILHKEVNIITSIVKGRMNKM